MNKFTINLLCFLGITYQVRAQVIYERTYPGEFPSIQMPVELSDTSTFSIGNNDECGGLRSRHIDVHGNELEGNIFYAEGFSSGYYWIGHDSVLIWVEHGAYDVGPDSLRVHIWTPGEINTILSVGLNYDFSDSRKYGAYLYSPERLVYEKTDTLYTKNLYSSIVVDSLVIGGISQIFEFERSILVFSDAEDPLLLDDRLEEIVEWDSHYTLPFNLYSAVVIDSFLVGEVELNTVSLGIVNVYDESQKILDLSTYFEQIEDVQANKNYLFVKGGDSGGGQFVLQFDKEFELVNGFARDIPKLYRQMTFQYYPDRVYAWCYDGLASYKANYRMSYQYQNAFPIKYLDIALDTAWVDSVYKYPEHYHLPANVFVSAVIRNLSPDTIHSLTIHWERTPDFWCDSGVYPYQRGGLNIAFNESDTISFQTWSYEVAHNLPYFETFFIHHGNNHLDSNWNNNIYELDYLSGSIDETVSAAVSVFPNPFTDFLKLSGESESSQLILYDQTGRLVTSGYGQLDNLGHLHAGMYVLQVISGHSSGVTRLLKVE